VKRKSTWRATARLEHHKLAIKGAEIRAEAVEKNLADLRARIAKSKNQASRLAPSPAGATGTEHKESQDLKRTILNNEEAMEKVRVKYAARQGAVPELTARP